MQMRSDSLNNEDKNKYMLKFANELRTNEEIVYASPGVKEVGGSIFLMITGFILPIMMVWAIITSIKNGNPVDGSFMIMLIIIGMLLLGQAGFYNMFIRYKNRFIVTNERLAVRGVNFLLIPFSYDIPLNKLHHITIIDYRVNGMHNHYRLRVEIDRGKRKAKRVVMLPQHPKELVQAMKETLGYED